MHAPVCPSPLAVAGQIGSHPSGFQVRLVAADAASQPVLPESLHPELRAGIVVVIRTLLPYASRWLHGDVLAALVQGNPAVTSAKWRQQEGRLDALLQLCPRAFQVNMACFFSGGFTLHLTRFVVVWQLRPSASSKTAFEVRLTPAAVSYMEELASAAEASAQAGPAGVPSALKSAVLSTSEEDVSLSSSGPDGPSIASRDVAERLVLRLLTSGAMWMSTQELAAVESTAERKQLLDACMERGESFSDMLQSFPALFQVSLLTPHIPVVSAGDDMMRVLMMRVLHPHSWTRAAATLGSEDVCGYVPRTPHRLPSWTRQSLRWNDAPRQSALKCRYGWKLLSSARALLKITSPLSSVCSVSETPLR